MVRGQTRAPDRHLTVTKSRVMILILFASTQLRTRWSTSFTPNVSHHPPLRRVKEDQMPCSIGSGPGKSVGC
jgi:hypothetical protein